LLAFFFLCFSLIVFHTKSCLLFFRS
jgi:hypothetical protein